MKSQRKSIVSFAVAAFSSCAAVAATNYFNWDDCDDGKSIETAVDFLNSSVWSAGKPVSTDTLTFRKNASVGYPAEHRFVKVAGGTFGGTPLRQESCVSQYYLDDTKPRTVVVSDSQLWSSGGYSFAYLMVYAPVWAKSWVQYATFCGDIYSAISANAGIFHRLDLYADEAGGTRVNPGPVDNFSSSYDPGYCMWAPRSLKTATTYEFTAVPDSPYLQPVDKSVGTALPAGATVSVPAEPESLAEGTFIKRIFPDGSIELSAAYGGIGGTVSLLVNPQPKVKVSQTVTYMYSGSGGNGLRLMKYDPDDELTFTIRNAYSNPGEKVYFDCYDGYYPGTVRFVNTSSCLGDLYLGNIYVELAENTSGGATLNGFTTGSMTQKGAGYVSHVVVTDNVSSVISNFKGLAGTLVKNGSGALRLGLTTETSLNTGTLVVSEGTLELDAGSWVKHLVVSNGATLKLNGDIKPDTMYLPAGAHIAGSGYLLVDSFDAVLKAGATFSTGTGIRLVGGTGAVCDRAPDALPTELSVQPAFWVDASKASSMVLETSSGVTYVKRISDVRKESESDSYMFATNVVVSPVLECDTAGHTNIYFAGTSIYAKPITECAELVWNRPIGNIVSVFIAHNHIDGGGQLLGMSPATAATLPWSEWGPFFRQCGATYSNAAVVLRQSDEATKAVWQGRAFHNGIAASLTNAYPYGSGKLVYKGSNSHKVYPIMVTDVHPTRGVTADCFAWQYGSYGGHGKKRLHELLVFTNELSEVERQSVENYLSKKWMNCEVAATRYPNGDSRVIKNANPEEAAAFAPTDGETIAIDGMSGAGTYSKRGEGVVTIDNVSDATTDISVEVGTLKLRSRTAASDSILPDGAYLHLDATRTEDMTFAAGTQELTAWKSADSSLTMTLNTDDCDNRPVLVANAINGKNAVDFGEPRSGYDTTKYVSKWAAKNYSGMKFTASLNIHTVVMIGNTAKSGGALAGAISASWGQDGLFRDGWGSTYNDVPPVTVDNAILVASTSMGNVYGFMHVGGTYAAQATLNDLSVKLSETPFTGGNDFVTLVSCAPIHASAFSLNQGWGYAGGGEIVGEYLLYERGLSPMEMDDVRAYINKKWYGRETAGYLPAHVGKIAVSPGATLDVTGNAPVLARGLVASGGEIDGSVELDAEAEIEIPVMEDGSVRRLTVTGDLDLSKGGTVVVSGEISKLAPGTYSLLNCSSLASGELGGWTVVGVPKYEASLSVVSGELILTLSKRGLSIFVR